ncbi:OLC1v1012828C2 [Oldenlandia corymbosa var. corymbosa]|uniref:OLC1v1012828C2 n=1 Tax=Oldenlandia corymbosa var. corymbosa TaxID=529605 RepID=A0AAV1DYQ7_OLDCO|nr:OLC1v1012828C2 [Oldenlandia corymbosa var. corymbosa]
MASSGKDEEEDTAGMERLKVLDGVKMVDAPIILFVLSHKAFVKELEELCKVSIAAVESGSCDRGVVDDLCRRFEFFKLVYEYHCAAEDEILFEELGNPIKNGLSIYAEEHKNIIGKFRSLLDCLNLLKKEETEELSNTLSELLSLIVSIKSIFCHHVLKEERQVFPFILKQFSLEKQAKIVWQYICALPLAVLEDFIRWMASLLPPEEQIDFAVGIKAVLPEEEVLQEVVISWLCEKKSSHTEAFIVHGIGARCHSGEASFGNLLELFPDACHFTGEEQSKKPRSTQSSSRENPIAGIHIMNSAIMREFREILVLLNQSRISATCSDISSLLIQLQFLADLLIFYSKALDQILYPMLEGLSKNGIPFRCKRLTDESQMGRLQSFLYGKLQFGSQLSNFLDSLCEELESLLCNIGNIFIYIDREVFSLMHENCGYKMQLWLLYAGLKSMPFGLLRCATLWLSATLCDEQFKIMVDAMNVSCTLVDKTLAPLLHEWIRSGYSSKISLESLAKAFGTCREGYCKFSRIKADTGFSDVEFEIQGLSTFNLMNFKPKSAVIKNIKTLNALSSLSNKELESSTFNLQRLFPQLLSYSYPMLIYPAEYGSFNNNFTLDSQPMIHLVCFHNALKRDLSHIVSLSANLSKSNRLFPDFRRCFQLLQFFYDVHIMWEDEVIFPALESKGKLKSTTHYYTAHDQLDTEQFKKVSLIVYKLSDLLDNPVTTGLTNQKCHQLYLELHEACLCMQKVICEHIHHEEIELRPLFARYFSIEEQETIIGRMLGRTGAETLTRIIPWLMSLLEEDEWQGLLSLWRKATKMTNFDEWLGDWCKGLINVPRDNGGSCSPPIFPADPIEMIRTFVGEQSFGAKCDITEDKLSVKDLSDHNLEKSEALTLHLQVPKSVENVDKHPALANSLGDRDVEKRKEKLLSTDQADEFRQEVKVSRHSHPLALSPKELENAIRKISCDPKLDSCKKSQVMQSLMMSHWAVTQTKLKMTSAAHEKDEDLGQHPSYLDSLNQIFGCNHYKRNCKLLAACCSKLFTCIRCHDDLTNHSVDRKTITKMMCMKCLVIQSIGPTCSNPECNDFSMAKYYCRICKLFDDKRQIYHCPYCNLCRVGKGLGIDYFHCMKCNACMSKSLSLHVCREKCFEDNCPICREDLFTSSSPVKALPCGHLMHSSCFQDYTFSHYTCPICSKSLGDMQIYFGMLDALLAEEKIPEEYSSQVQVENQYLCCGFLPVLFLLQ